jgi:hypothetical protein
VKADWRKLRNQELHDVNFSASIIRIIKSMRLKWTGHVACTGRRRMLMGIGGKSRRKEAVGKQKCIIFEYITKGNLRTVGWGGIHSTQDKEPWDSGEQSNDP